MTRSKRYVVEPLELAERLIRALPITSVSQKQLDSLARGDLVAFVSCSIDPDGYDREERDLFMIDYFVSEVFSKFDSFELGIDRRKKAYEKFYATEVAVRDADNRLRHGLKGVPIGSPIHSILHAARLKIENILGQFDWNEVYMHTSFGPGASIGVPRRESDAFNKYGKLKPSVTRTCLPLARAAICSNPAWSSYHTEMSGGDPDQWFTIVPGNKVVTVPKNAKIDRVIAIEPQMNMYIQKGIGGVIRSRLKSVGCNLNDQTLNQDLARLGSIDGQLATIDLASASDCISLAWCQFLLPPDWMTAIEYTRSQSGVTPDGEILYRKVSSMGNGYTFELESLIFLALIRATLDHLRLSGTLHSVYGDDIVIHTDAVQTLIGVLSFLGFETNQKKSFTSSKCFFRESCGKHYFSGSDVTPFYVRKPIVGFERLIWLANSIRAFAHRIVGQGYGCDMVLENLWNYVCGLLPDKLRSKIRGPLWVGNNQSDSFLGTTFDDACPSRARFGEEGYLVSSIRRRHGMRIRASLPSFIRWMDDVRDVERPLIDPKLCTAWERFPYLPANHGQLGGKGEVSMTEYPTQSYRLAVSRQLVVQWQDCGPWVRWLNPITLERQF